MAQEHDGDDGEGEGQSRDQDPVAQESRETGGDAPAAGSVEERESVAADEDDLFEGDDAD